MNQTKLQESYLALSSYFEKAILITEISRKFEADLSAETEENKSFIIPIVTCFLFQKNILIELNKCLTQSINKPDVGLLLASLINLNKAQLAFCEAAFSVSITYGTDGQSDTPRFLNMNIIGEAFNLNLSLKYFIKKIKKTLIKAGYLCE